MANYRKIGFTLAVRRGEQILTLARAFPDLDDALAAALAIGRQRPVGVEGMVILSAVTGEEWTVGSLQGASRAGASAS